MADHDGLGDRDERLRRTEQNTYERARKVGLEHGRAKEIAKEATEKADVEKKRLGHW